MTALRVFAVVVAAILIQSLLARLSGYGRMPVDLVLVAVVSVALIHGRVAGLLGGTLAGLAQDALSGGVLGIGGLAKSLSGFLAGVLGTQFIVTQSVPRFLIFIGATALNEIVFSGLGALLGLSRFDQPYLDLAVQALVNGGVGVLLFEVIEFLPGARERWRARHERRGKARYR